MLFMLVQMLWVLVQAERNPYLPANVRGETLKPSILGHVGLPELSRYASIASHSFGVRLRHRREGSGCFRAWF